VLNGELERRARIDAFLRDLGAALSEWIRRAGARATTGGCDACAGQAEPGIVEDVERLRDEVVSIRQIRAAE
jgi:hypothetical protein